MIEYIYINAMATHPFPSFPKPDIPMGYNVHDGRKTFKAEYHSDMYAQLILNNIPVKHVNHVCTWKDNERNTTIITVIGGESNPVWDDLHHAMDMVQVDYEYV